MASILQTLGILFLTAAGVFFGRFLSRLQKTYWIAAYALSLGLFGLVMATRWFPHCLSWPLFSWLVAGRMEAVMMSVAVTIMLGCAIPKLPRMRQRVMAFLFLSIAAAYFSILPFLLPAVLQSRLANLETCINPQNICIQQTAYTCGPASAVTSLRKLGIDAREGDIALAAYSNPVTGTPPDMLMSALYKLYGKEGITCEYRIFDSISELDREDVVIIVAIRFSFMVDHYVTILEITDDKVVVGDSLLGRQQFSVAEFGDVWRHDGIILKRTEEAD